VSARRGRGIDRELEVGSLAHYEDAAWYARTYADRIEDVAYYVARAKDHGGPVLEYGCGAGRITIPIARSGISIVGVDHSAPMLADLKARAAKETIEVRRRITVRRGDMRSVTIRRKFRLIVSTFNTFLHLYDRDDVERHLARVRGHLSRDGLFVFDASVPVPIDLARDPSRPQRTPKVLHPTLGRARYQERFDYDPIRQVLFVAMEIASDDGREVMTPLAHRQFFPAELETLLHYNGFEVVKREGGFRGEPIDRHVDTIVWTCRARTHRR
jgi:SAM-dependent methyltransferase